MIFTVGSNAELSEAFLNASSGDRIELLGGEYDTVNLKNRDFAEALIITSASSDTPAIFRGALTLSNLDNVEISGISFQPDDTALSLLDVVLITGSQRVTLVENTFEGHVPAPGQGLPGSEDIDTAEEAGALIEGQPYQRGIRVTDSQNVRIEDNSLSLLRKGIILDRVQEVDLIGNHLHDLRSDGVNLVDAVSVTIAGNLMESFRPLHNYDHLAYADHGDFIQWWAGSGGMGIRDLTIRDNALLQGAGSWTQGIFGRGGRADADGRPLDFDGIRIENNLINTSHPNAIFVGDAKNVEITGNTLLPAPIDLTQPVITSGVPSISIRTSASLNTDGSYDFSVRGALPTNIRVVDNLVVGEQAFHSYLIDPTLWLPLDITQSGNTVLSVEPGSAGFWTQFFPELGGSALSNLGQLANQPGIAGVDPSLFPIRLTHLLSDPERQTGSVQVGTENNDVIRADGSGRIVDGASGDDSIFGTSSEDVLRGGLGSDYVTTGSGRDRITFLRSDIAAGDIDTIVDLDFEGGDHLVFSGGFGPGFFDDNLVSDNVLTTFGDGDSAIVHDRNDLLELARQAGVSVHSAGPDAVELRFDLDGDAVPDWFLRLQGIFEIGEIHSHLDSSGLRLEGTSSRDTLTGGSGNDVLHGNGADDLLTGGGGADLFAVSWLQLSHGTDLSITDLDFAGGDRLHLFDMPAVFQTEGLSDGTGISIHSFEAVRELASNSTADFVVSENSDAILSLDLNGDGTFDAIIRLGSNHDLAPSVSQPGLVLGTEQSDLLLGGLGEAARIFGAGGDDLLIGQSGSDQMYGGAGDDRFYISSPGARALEASDGGYDRVYASVDYTIGAYIEALSAQGTGNLRLTGNAGDNWITGNSGNNFLAGHAGRDRLIGLNGNDWLDGGAGADVLQGGRGEDNYLVDHRHDLVMENAAEGYDRVYTKVDFRLGANVEALAALGNGDLLLVGNGSDNWLTGNAGSNFLAGGDGKDRLIGGAGDDVLDGGTGSDVLQGGEGCDVFVFSAGSEIDLILDFEPGVDLIRMDSEIDAFSLRAVQTPNGVMIYHGWAGDVVVLQGTTKSAVNDHAIFAGEMPWVLDF